MAALFQTAGDLTSVHDVQNVLRAIVHRVRELFGSDTSYLMLFDPDARDTYMRVSEGITTAAFADLRLPLGGGLGGLVAQDVCPYSTSTYLSDLRFQHDAVVDKAVVHEGLSAIMGVPLVLGEQTLGVLFVAERHPRSYSRQEATLLLSLANHAAVALENARLLHDSQAALTDLAAAKAVIEEHSRQVERSVVAHQQLTDVVLRGGTLRDVASVLAETIGGSIVIVAPNGRILASGGSPVDDLDETLMAGTSVTLPHEMLTRIGEAEQRRQTVHAQLHPWWESRWITPIVAGSDVTGSVVLACRKPPVDTDIQTLERAAQVIALLMLWQRSTAQAEERARGDLIIDLLGSTSLSEEFVRRRCALLGMPVDDGYALVVARQHSADQHSCLAAARQLATASDGMAGMFDGDVVLLLRSRDIRSTAEWTRAHLSGRVHEPVTCGADGPVGLLGDVRSGFTRARRALRLLQALGKEGQAVCSADAGLYGLLFDAPGQDRVADFVHARLASLERYDAEHQSDLVTTLSTYLASGRHPAEAARQLNIHPNTLYQRLQRIATVGRIDLNDQDDALQVHLALRLRHLSGRV